MVAQATGPRGKAIGRIVARSNKERLPHGQGFELPRSVLELAERQKRIEPGRVVVPHRYGDKGWYDYRPIKPAHPAYLWTISQDPRDERLLRALTAGVPLDTLAYDKSKGDWEHAAAWLGFVAGRNPDYPLQILRATYAASLERLEVIRQDATDPAEWDVHHWQQRNPLVLEGLVQLMLGAPNHVYHGGLLHCRLFYFDPQRRRPGVPPDVAALVDRVTADGVSVQLVNLHPTESREVILQAGAFGEHRFTAIRHQHDSTDVNGKMVHVRLRPGARGRLEIGISRYAHRPSYARPWGGSDVP